MSGDGLKRGEPQGALAHHHNAARYRGHPGAPPHVGFLPAQTARAPDGWLGSSLQAAAARTRAPKPQRRSPEATTTTSPTRFVVSGLTGKRFTLFKASLWKGPAGGLGCATSVLQGLIMPEVQALIRANLRLGGEHAVCVPGGRPHPAAFPWRVISRVLRHSRAC